MVIDDVADNGGDRISAGGGKCVGYSGSCEEYIFNMNVQVLGFEQVESVNQSCSTIIPPILPDTLMTNQSGTDPAVSVLVAGEDPSWALRFFQTIPGCEGQDITEMSEDCYDALGGTDPTGYFIVDSSCEGPRGIFVYNAIQYAYRILNLQGGTPSWPGTDVQQAAAEYWMGPDYLDYINQIRSNNTRPLIIYLLNCS